MAVEKINESWSSKLESFFIREMKKPREHSLDTDSIVREIEERYGTKPEPKQTVINNKINNTLLSRAMNTNAIILREVNGEPNEYLD